MTKEQHRKLFVLAYLYFYPGTEGKGGKRAERDAEGHPIGSWWPGTRLRQPKGPLYDLNKQQRQAIFDELIKVGCLTVTGTHPKRNLPMYQVTPLGLEILKKQKLRLIGYSGNYRNPANGISYESSGFFYGDPSNVVDSNDAMSSVQVNHRIYHYE